MNKNAIQAFTQWAKVQLTSAIKQKAFEYGITETSIDESVSIVNGRVLSQIEQNQRKTLINKIKEEGYEQVIEEVTYTWFNRFIALRFMEVNGYLPTRVRVFSDENNKFNNSLGAFIRGNSSNITIINNSFGEYRDHGIYFGARNWANSVEIPSNIKILNNSLFSTANRDIIKIRNGER